MEPIFSHFQKNGCDLESIKFYKDDNVLTLKAKSAEKLS